MYTGKPALPPKYDYPAPQSTDPKLPVSDLDFKHPLQFGDILPAAMNEHICVPTGSDMPRIEFYFS